MKAFYDGSTTKDDNGDEWITFAGVAATDRVWAEFDTRWAKMLTSRYPIAPYIHMIELLDDKDPFERLAGWEPCKKQALVQDAVVLLSQMNKSEFRMTWSSINESARIRLEREGLSRIPKSATLRCASECVFTTIGYYLLNVPEEQKESIYVFFDRGEPFLGKFKNKYLEHRTPPGRPKNPDNWFDFFADVQDIDLPYHSGLQAADIVAWAHSRSLSERERPFSWLKDWLLKVVPSSRVEYSEDVLRNPKEDPSVRAGWERIFL